ncbi:MAG: FAD-binding oxidoreductase, partial [Planctomycetes bacterium]|nr:FAD-binding oxidoreductase [Planctomycetota bacterium]
GIPLAARMLGNIDALARWGSWLAPLSNWLARSRPARWLNEKLLGIDRRRTPPAWRRQTFSRWFIRRGNVQSAISPGAPGQSVIPDHPPLTPGSPGLRSTRQLTLPVTFFNDTFTNYLEPEIGIAAVELLEAGGLTVELAAHRCCSRPQISQGLLEQARQLAAANAELLFPLADRGQKIVFCEPSCLSAMREDAPALLRGELRRKAELVARSCWLFEEFLEQGCQTGDVRLALEAGPTKILLHGHCHQKAMGALAPAMALLSRIPNCSVVDLDAGCCGMAGSFGYLREHYDSSQKIAERRLLPAIHSKEPGAVVLATGTSCRHQIQHFGGERAIHPAVLLRTLLAGDRSGYNS